MRRVSTRVHKQFSFIQGSGNYHISPGGSCGSPLTAPALLAECNEVRRSNSMCATERRKQLHARTLRHRTHAYRHRGAIHN